MISILAQPLAAGLIFLAAQINGANEVLPVDHNEPITIRVLSGRNGLPLAQAHIVLTAGYNQRDIDLRMRREEALTDEHGTARLPNALSNFPLLHISVAKQHLCHSGGRGAIFSIERIRRDGLSAPNRCGTAMVQDAPGIFTVWVKTGKAPSAPFIPALSATAPSAPPTVSNQSAAPVAVPASPPAAPAPGIAAHPLCPAIPRPAPPPAPDPARNRHKHLPPLAPA